MKSIILLNLFLHCLLAEAYGIELGKLSNPPQIIELEVQSPILKLKVGEIIPARLFITHPKGVVCRMLSAGIILQDVLYVKHYPAYECLWLRGQKNEAVTLSFEDALDEDDMVVLWSDVI